MAKKIVNGHVIKTDSILTGDDLAPAMKVKTYREWAKKVRKESRVALLIMNGAPINFEPQGDSVTAQIQFGRWVATCPDCGTTAVENVEPNDPFFFCFNCCNADNDFHVREAIFPPLPARKKIEERLLVRQHKDMFWTPNETEKDLEDQNKVLEAKGRLR